MYFLVNNNKKIIFGWSAKCACKHIKKMWWYLNNIDNPNIHKGSYCKLPNNINKYTTIIFTRNPYKRIVSGFLDENNYIKKDKWKKKINIIF